MSFKATSFKKEINGQRVTIDVSDESGTFSHTTAAGDCLTDDSLPKLVEKIRRLQAKRKITVNVLVGILNGYRPENRYLRQLSTRERGGVLTRGEDGKAAEEVRTHDTVYKPWTDETRASYEALRKAYVAAGAAIEAFQQSCLYQGKDRYQSHAGTIVEKALAAKEAEQDAKAAQTRIDTIQGVCEHGVSELASCPACRPAEAKERLERIAIIVDHEPNCPCPVCHARRVRVNEAAERGDQ